MLASMHKIELTVHAMENSDSIQSQGGKARAEKLSADQKKEIAIKAATARWGARPIQALRKGSFKEEFGTDVDCYVLDDAQKTAVVSSRGMARALGLSALSGGAAFSSFLSSQTMSGFVDDELRQKLSQPINFQWRADGSEQAPISGNGYDATVLIDVCLAVIESEKEGKLQKRHAKIASQAHVILNASAKSGIRGLVYALAGYNPTAEEVIAAFKKYVSEEARKYEKEFPPELYDEWYRLYQIPVIDGPGRPWYFKKLTVNHVYTPLAKSNGRILELVRASKSKGGDRRAKLFQFLNEVGTRALRFHLGRLVEMAQGSQTKAEYEAKIVKRFGGEEQMELIIPEPPEVT